MKKFKLIILFIIFISHISAQEVVNSFVYSDGYSVIPKSVVEVNNNLVIPYSITKNNEKKAGLIYLNFENKIDKVILFEGKHDYVINQIIPSQQNSNILVSAEGYSQQGQESLYFLEIDNGNIVNDFIYNEGGNELDPFSILEVGNNILIGGFVKSRELISNSFYNMYSEKQMIYVGEFTKSGTKIWSKGIDLEGYEKGICNSMIKVDDYIVLLCHAKKIGEEMSPILIKINKKGEVKSIVQIDNNNKNTIGSALRNHSGNIELYGSYSEDDNHFLYKTTLSKNLELLDSEEYIMPYRFIINGINNSGELFGGLLIKGGGFNNCIISILDNTYILNVFGSNKSDLVFGLDDKFIYSYTIGSSIYHTSTINIFKKDFSIKEVNLNKVKSRIRSISNIKFIYEEKFVKNTINKGVEKVKVVDVNINLN